MASPTIQFKRGNAGIAGTLPVGLKEGEPGFTLNYSDFFIGIDETVENNKFFGSSRYWIREDNETSLRLSLVDRNGINNIQLKSPNTLSGITTYTLPETPIDTYFLKTDELGNLSWSSEFSDIIINSAIIGIATITNYLNITSQIESFSKDTGALVIDGGVGIEKNLNVGGNLKVQGISEFVGIVTFRGGTINIGDSDEDDINVVGEFISNLVPNSDNTFSIGVGTNKRWKNANFSGIGTFSSGLSANNISIGLSNSNTIDTYIGNLILNSNGGTIIINDNLEVSGVSTFASDLDINSSIDVQNQTQLNTLNVSGVSTFASNLDINSSVDIQNQTQLNTLNVSGVSTFVSNVDINSSIDVQNQTQLNTLNVSGVSTFNNLVSFASSVIFGDNDILSFGDGTDLKLFHNGSNSYIQDFGIGALLIQSDELAIQNETGTENFARFLTNSSVQLYYDNIKKFETTGYGATVLGTIQSQGVKISGVSTFSSDVDVNASIDVQNQTQLNTLNVTGISTFISESNFGSNISVANNGQFGSITVIGVTTSTGGFDGDLTGNAGTATSLANSRTFQITGDIVASPINFDGTGNVSLAATIQPNSVGLGTDTFGDYIKSISGTSNQITVTGGTGEGSTPVISIPDSPTLPGNVTVANDLLVNNNLNIYGNIMIGGTIAVVAVEELLVKDKELVLGFTTDSSGNEVSNDSTANGGGISIASTEGSPLVDFNISGIHTHPNTYKDIIWIKSGTLGAGTTDAWHFNYAVGIGSTQVPNNVVFAAGAVQFTNDDLVAVRNINVSGLSTFASNVDINNNLTVTGTTQLNSVNITGQTSFNTISVATTSTLNKVILQSLWVDDCAGNSQVINCIGAERILQNVTIDCGTY